MHVDMQRMSDVYAADGYHQAQLSDESLRSSRTNSSSHTATEVPASAAPPAVVPQDNTLKLQNADYYGSYSTNEAPPMYQHFCLNNLQQTKAQVFPPQAPSYPPAFNTQQGAAPPSQYTSFDQHMSNANMNLSPPMAGTVAPPYMMGMGASNASMLTTLRKVPQQQELRLPGPVLTGLPMSRVVPPPPKNSPRLSMHISGRDYQPDQCWTTSPTATSPTATSADDLDFIIDTARIYGGHETRTTCMLRNIPSRYTEQMLVRTFMEEAPGVQMNYINVPVNAPSGRNKGYAFVSFNEPADVARFYEAFHGRGWSKFKSEKICQVVFAKVQDLSIFQQNLQAMDMPDASP
eukprot:gnl/TRDRNA2_/TRDRNA2_155340_c1_seq1.p1 gnl/TRDRNA2_/TRDRNA2_155340_c1~~gnl/TRDRNA2_/TRDRNA2_155340_c1_seq1.p1  ORF type:complete len:348 (+),score=64.39 gnl/TRDRNA2_/TRDRNA2_155340_c1_seq1:1-1044(+)